MKQNFHFKMNPALAGGIMLNACITLLLHLTEPTGMLNNVFCWVHGLALGLLFLGLLYGSSKTRPLFHRFHAFKLQLLGRL